MRKQVKKNDKPIQDVLKDFASQSQIGPGYYNSKIEQIWNAKMGQTIVGYTRKLYFAKGVLYLKLDSAPLKNELMMGKTKIIALINGELKKELVKDVKIS